MMIMFVAVMIIIMMMITIFFLIHPSILSITLYV